MPNVDDGAKSIEESLAILKSMYDQGITDVIATPHFYASKDTLESYRQRLYSAFTELQNAMKGKELPNVYLGSEVLYYKNIGSSESIVNFCLAGTNYLLLEFADESIDEAAFKEIINLRRNFGIEPIIAHIERYHRSKNYKKLLKFVEKENILTQFNAVSLFNPNDLRMALKLLKKGLPTFIATDSHSIKERPPLMQDALDIISKKFGPERFTNFVRNSQDLLSKLKESKNDIPNS